MTETRTAGADPESWVQRAFELTRVGAAEDARIWMEKAADHGHRQAPIFAAIWRLVGYAGPVEPDAAARLLRRAVENNEPLGLTMLAALAVSDLQGPRNWDVALSRLIDAAQLSEPRAMLQLAMLLPFGDAAAAKLMQAAAARNDGTARYFHGRALCDSPDLALRAEGMRWLTDMASRGEPCSRLYLARRDLHAVGGAPSVTVPDLDVDWNAVADRVQWPHARAIPAHRVHSTEPWIAIVPGLLTGDECHYLISRGAPYLQPAQVGASGGAKALVNVRNNDSMLFSPADTDVVVQSIDSRIANTLAQPAAHGERLALLRYGPGQAYGPHCDWIDPAAPGKAQHVASQGQRVSTLIAYLNDEFDEGETRFLRLGWSFKGKPGDALLWSNVTAAGDIDVQTLHAGAPPAAGEKWLLSKWMRNRPQVAR